MKSLVTGWPLILVICVSAGWTAAELNVGPYLQNVAPDGVTVMWETTEPVVGTVEYGLPGQMDRKAAENEARTIHELRLTGLQAGTAYAYRATWDGGATETYEFKTAPPPGAKRWRLAVYGDSRSDPTAHSAVVAQILAAKPDLVLHTGDLVSDGRQYDLWKPQFFEPLAPLMARIPLFPCLGNHEGNSEHYYRYFSLPNNEAWYSFDYANAHFLCLDSCQPYTEGTEQYRWLEQDLRNAQADWLIAFFHHPLFSCHPTRSINGNRWAWQPLFQKYGVDLVFTGHDHHYQRTYPVGSAAMDPLTPVLHFTTGGGGAGLYPVQPYSYTRVAQAVHHGLLLDFDGTVLRARAVDKEGNEIDSFVVDQSQAPAAEEFIAWEPFLWEKAVQEAIGQLEPATAYNNRVSLRPTLRLPFPLPVRVTGEVEWSGDNAAWQFETAKTAFELNPGGEWELSIQARADWPQCYPLPTATVRITGGDWATDFRNKEFVIAPLRVRPAREARAHWAAQPPVLDGKLDDACWEKSPAETQFVRSSGENLAALQTAFRVAYDSTTFYFAAEAVTENAALVEAGQTERDHGRILSHDESVLVSAFFEGQQFEFGVNSRGTRYDARNGDTSWNPEWSAAVLKTETGWNVEAAIPYTVVNAPESPPYGYTLSLNVARLDAARRERSEWSPTFGQWQREGRSGTLVFE